MSEVKARQPSSVCYSKALSTKQNAMNPGWLVSDKDYRESITGVQVLRQGLGPASVMALCSMTKSFAETVDIDHFEAERVLICQIICARQLYQHLSVKPNKR